MRYEPVAVVNGIVTIIEATIAVAVGFGIDMTAEQVGLLMALVVAVGNLVMTLWTRSQVTPVLDPQANDGTPLVRADAREDGTDSGATPSIASATS